MSIKLDSKQQEQMIQDLKAREVSEETLDAVAGGIIAPPLPLGPFPQLPGRFPTTWLRIEF